ncbi:thioredoxin-like [Hyperolius riggenbachi]|uniref:thioredoxin-like n=1 Tax=Hyperolius riggenbachi TaxID=752182 RepID=UPI0035A34CAD
MVKELEDVEEFNVIMETAGDKLLVIDFTAVWCGPCKRISPVFEALSHEYPDVLFYKVDVDNARDIAESCGIRAMPTFHFYKNGSKIDEICGADEAELRKKVACLK